ncbi:hypothetical protein N7468_010124 [Penicillium chermesinum]|uniref:Indole-diterpene biosynthesis protein PaxU n=1 Tax=Penicillium chermesinum TaxID=63820 RepID=A0A9W9TC57_9EURO|nr:uncharacterized protein N7468_010124 [Penicillium chermesinum]KAJ5217116.1 hypothetical protein N7468_010124 [Penicillium chermesinum]
MSTAQPPDTLPPSTNLTPTIFLNEPTASTPSQTILLAFWMNAPVRTYTKYLADRDFLLPTSTPALQKRLTPAVEVLRASPTPVHIHLFSNGGVFAVTTLLSAYKARACAPLPVSAILIDSAPGRASIREGLRAFSFALPRTFVLRVLGKAVLCALFVVVYTVNWVLRRPDAIQRGRIALNDSELVGGDPARCYLYSDGDELVGWRDVEDHADEAEGSGLRVRREKFVGSPHVAHMKADPVRYWGVVREYLGI